VKVLILLDFLLPLSGHCSFNRSGIEEELEFGLRLAGCAEIGEQLTPVQNWTKLKNGT
jgi:hypothetical protein